jgi:hypothetical protein
MRALSKLTFGGDEYLGDFGQNVIPEPAVLVVGMAEADFSNKNLGVGGAIITAAWISHKDNGAILSVNLLKNGFGVEQARALVIILKEHPTLESLCGNNGDDTELDMSGKMKGAEDAIMLAAEIVDNGALSTLIFGGEKDSHHNHNGTEWVTPEPGILEVGMSTLDLSNKGLGAGGAIIISAWLTHKDNGALTLLDVSNNNLGVLATEDGWTSRDGDNSAPWVHPDGRCQSEKPDGLKPLGAIAIANAIPDMRAILKFTFSGDSDSKSVTMETTMTVADFSEKNLGVSGAIMLSAFLPKCT